MPRLPAGFEGYALPEKIDARISTLGPPTVRCLPRGGNGNGQELTQKVVLSAGSDDGVLPRMSFDSDDEDLAAFSIIITVVRKKESEGILRFKGFPIGDGKKPRVRCPVSHPCCGKGILGTFVF